MLLSTCRLLLISQLVSASPVAYIVRKNQPTNINHVATALIITEKLLVAPREPFSSLVQSDVCVLAVSHLHDLPEKYVSSRCIDIRRVFFSSLVLIELAKDITFTAELNPAMIPIVANMTANATTNCRMAYHVRDGSTGQVTAQGLTDVAVGDPCKKEQNVTARDGFVCEQNATATAFAVEVKEKQKYCVQDNGLPLYCGSMVMGMFWFDSGENSCCLNACKSAGNIRVVNFHTDEVYEFLTKHVRVPDD